MLDYFPKLVRKIIGLNLKSWRDRFKGVGTKKIILLSVFMLVVITRLFFSVSFEEKAWAKNIENVEGVEDVDLNHFDPMEKIRTETDIKDEKICAEVAKEKDLKTLDIPEKEKVEKKNTDRDSERIKTIKDILAGSPMEKMVEALGGRNKDTAAFLVAIAKKESDWGRHAPSKSGRDCYNYWGYKGNYNLSMGYSCFDSPEQAVEMVGGRIDELQKKGLNTPEKMVVWKCGSSCSWDKPENVRSWIGAVRTYWSKLV